MQLKDDRFDMLFHSPLKRADQTAQIIWGSRQGEVSVLPSLREVDLYSFQVRPSYRELASFSLHSLYEAEKMTGMNEVQRPIRSHASRRDF